jgi:hypothetical protein
MGTVAERYSRGAGGRARCSRGRSCSPEGKMGTVGRRARHSTAPKQVTGGEDRDRRWRFTAWGEWPRARQQGARTGRRNMSPEQVAGVGEDGDPLRRATAGGRRPRAQGRVLTAEHARQAGRGRQPGRRLGRQARGRVEAAQWVGGWW